MSTKSFAWGSLLSAVVLVGMTAPSYALTEVARTGDWEIGVGGRMNLMGQGEVTNETIRDKYRIYLFQKNSRLEFSARQGDNLFYSQLALGGEDVYTSNNNLTLLDMYTKLPTPVGNLVAGQYKVPWSREQLTDGGNLVYNKRSLLELGFQLGRDYGVGLQGSMGPLNTMVGVYAGGGRDIPERYIPVKMGVPMMVARIGVGDIGKDLYSLPEPYDTQRSFGEDVRSGLYLNGVYTKATLVGHGNTMSQRKFDNTILLSTNWNPYLGAVSGNAASGNEYWAAGVDYTLQSGPLTTEVEVNHAQFSNNLGNLKLSGARAQVGYNLNPVELGLRYSALFPDDKFAATNATTKQTFRITPDAKAIQEIAPSITWFINGHNLKLVADLPIQLDAPVVTEKGLGDYNLINQPDQTSYLATGVGTISRQLIIQGRLGLQYQF